MFQLTVNQDKRVNWILKRIDVEFKIKIASEKDNVLPKSITLTL